MQVLHRMVQKIKDEFSLMEKHITLEDNKARAAAAEKKSETPL
jgi:hypothetical protein